MELAKNTILKQCNDLLIINRLFKNQNFDSGAINMFLNGTLFQKNFNSNKLFKMII